MGKLRWLHVSAITVAVFIVLLIVSGAFITSGEEQSWTVSTTIHIVAAIVTGISVLGLAVALTMTKQRCAWPAGRRDSSLVNSGLGLKGGLPLTPTMAIIHAVFAPALLAIVTAVPIATSAGWRRGSSGRGLPGMAVSIDAGNCRAISGAHPNRPGSGISS
jgi:hypothetical protein